MRFTKTIASASVAAVLGLAGVSVAGATSTSSAEPRTATTAAGAPNASDQKPAANKAGRKARRRHAKRQAGALVAKTIGITPAELTKELRAGKTIATIATDHGVLPQAVIDALESAATARIDAAVAANKITAERAVRLKTRATTAIPKIVNAWHPRRHAAG